jgi:hypothetical protein
MFAEAIYRLHQLALERLPAHLTVRDYREPCPLLQPDSPVHGTILNALELGGREPACSVAFARLEQFLRPKEAADDVCAGGNVVLHTNQSSTSPPLEKPNLARASPLLNL